ncbi:MAG TPA: hypothetical protein VGH32_02075 [Pirellulales bacterium]
MKRLSYCALILALLSAPAFAAKNSQSVNFPDAITVGSTQLPAGDYKVSWDGTGANVQVTLEQKGVSHPATATVAAKVVEQKNNRNGYLVDSKGGVNMLETLQFSKFDVVLAGASAHGE